MRSSLAIPRVSRTASTTFASTHRALKAAFAKKNPTMTVGPLIRGVPPLEFPTLSPDCPVQTLTVTPPFLVDSPPKGAVYQYNCTPEFKELKKQGCKCNQSPPPIPIDVKQREDAKDKEKKREKDKEGQPDGPLVPQPAYSTAEIILLIILIIAAIIVLIAAVAALLAPVPEPTHKVVAAAAAAVGAAAAFLLLVGKLKQQNQQPQTA